MRNLPTTTPNPIIERRGWLAWWLQGRRRKRRLAPAVTDLAIVSRSVGGFQVQWSATGSVTYHGYYRVHGDADWISLGQVSEAETAFDIPEATEHSFDLKVTARGDGIIFSAAEVDSNVVQTVNDSELPPAPAITDLVTVDVLPSSVLVHWESVLLDTVDFEAFYREHPSGEWVSLLTGVSTDEAAFLEPLEPDVTYDFKLQTFGNGDQFQYSMSNRSDSNVITETTGEAAPEPPTDIVEDTYMDGGVSYVAFSWTEPPGGADSYILGIAAEEGHEDVFQNEEGFAILDPGIVGTETDAYSLEPAADFVVAVKSVKNGLESAWSAFVHFTMASD